MPTPSDIIIRYDGTDITGSVLFESARFQANANALPGEFSFTVKDPAQTLSFVTGKEVTLTIDGVKLFGGILLTVTRKFAFPVVNTSNLSSVTQRMWELRGVDYNIWFDKLVLRNEADYLHAIELSNGPQYDGYYIREHLGDYLDLPSGVDMSTYVDDVRLERGSVFAFVTQGSKWRDQMEAFRRIPGAVFYIDADKKLHYHGVEDLMHPWALVDHEPNGMTTIGCREVTATEDGTQIVTDALVWGGNEVFAESTTSTPEGSGLWFYRFPDPPANTTSADGQQVWTAAEEQKGIDKLSTYGRWQHGEQNFGQGWGPENTALRAKYLVIGPAGSTPRGIETGFGQPLWSITAKWYAHDVPSGNHLRPGYLMNIFLYVMGGATPLIQLLPARMVTITFPQIPEAGGAKKTFVQFDGQFGLQFSDHRRLWQFIRKNRTTFIQTVASQTNANSESAAYGSFASLTTTQAPNGALQTFAVQFPYLSGTLRVYLNGLYQRPGIEWRESDPASGEIEFYTAPLSTDEIWIEYRTGVG